MLVALRGTALQGSFKLSFLELYMFLKWWLAVFGIRGLCREDVQMSSEGLVCLLRQSKTDQLGHGKLGVLFQLSGSEVCPV